LEFNLNYLAHAALAQPKPQSLVGNLLGDFCKGVAIDTLAQPIRAGLANHRAVDRFTDSHPLVREARGCFSSERRRFAPVALDVLFDHFLIRHWQQFYATPYPQAKSELYQQLATAEPLMPETMAVVMRKIRQQDWLAAYQHLDGLAMVLDRIAQRIRFANRFSGAGRDIARHYPRLEQVFLSFYPELQAHVAAQGLERRAQNRSR
jgi:acyl carrier protein phosphodiesterase